MEYLYLIMIIILYFPLSLTNKLSSDGTTQKSLMLKYGLFRAVIGVVIGLIIMLISKAQFYIDYYTILICIVFGIMLASCMLLTFYSMQVTTIAISTMFSCASTIIPSIVGIVWFDDPITLWKVVGIIIFLFSIYLIVWQTNDDKQRFNIKAFVACMGVFLTCGLGSVSMQLFARCVPDGDESVFMFLSYCVQAVIMLVLYIGFCCKTNNKQETLHKMSKKLIICGIFGTAVSFIIQQGVTVLATNIPAVALFTITTGSSVISGVIIGFVLFKEKQTLKNIIGVIIGIISLIIINSF